MLVYVRESPENTAGGRVRRVWIEGNQPYARRKPNRTARHQHSDGAMSVILTASNGKIAMAAPGRPMLAGPLPSTVPGGGSTGLASVAGLAGWWDAGVVTTVLGGTGTPLSVFGTTANAVADKSGAGSALTVWHHASSGTNAPTATGHLNGLLGGIGLKNVTLID
jgi:hypothetical protein